jgi:peptide/nickel transport system substrate-binding protein
MEETVSRTVRVFMLAAIAASVGACRCASGSDGPRDPNTDDPPTKNDNPNTPTAEGSWEDGVLPASIREGTPRRGGQITVHIHTEPPSLNTIRHSDLVATWLTTHRIYEALLRLDAYDHPNYGFQPELAAELPEISEDGLVYTFRLRQNVKWHDGEAFDADDVIATFDLVRDTNVLAEHLRSYLEELEGYEKVDQYTVRFRWKTPYFLATEVFDTIPIYPQHIISRAQGALFNDGGTNPLMRNPVGTGPWKFVEWQSHERIVVVRNDDWWNERKPYLDRITFRIVEDSQIAVQLAERGELDVVTRIQAAGWNEMRSPYLREHYWRSRFFENNYAWIGWNQLRPIFQDKRVRRALTMLIDRPGIINSIFFGLYREASCHFYAPRAECDYGGEPIPYDPVAAAALLEEAGWRDTNNNGTLDKDGVEFAFTFMIPTSSREAGMMATKIKEDFERARIDMEIQRVEWSNFTERLRNHEFDACTLLWGNTSPRTDATQIWHSSSTEGGSNYISFRNERVDQILEQARRTVDDDARTELLREFGRILWDEQPYTWLYTRPALSLYHKRLRGVHESLAWYQFADWWVVEDEEN